MKWVKVLLPFENYIKPEQNKTSCYRHASMKKVRHMLIKNEGQEIHCVKNVYIWKFSGPYFPAFAPYSFQMRENTNQENSEYGQYSRNDISYMNHPSEHFRKLKFRFNLNW